MVRSNPTKSRLSVCIMLAVGLLCMPGAVLGADVDVYAEGAYTNTDLVIYIYANINSGPILSFGVRVEYPAALTFASATKNEAVWYFGDGSSTYPYMNPENNGPGTDNGVVIIGGKLNTGDPLAGVIGNRVLLGTVRFTHGGVTDFSAVSLTYGRSEPAFSNFVDVDGVVKDGGGVSFLTPTIARRGDANADGMINNVDLGVIRNLILGNVPGVSYRVYADANADGRITNVDLGVVRNMILGIN